MSQPRWHLKPETAWKDNGRPDPWDGAGCSEKGFNTGIPRDIDLDSDGRRRTGLGPGRPSNQLGDGPTNRLRPETEKVSCELPRKVDTYRDTQIHHPESESSRPAQLWAIGRVPPGGKGP